MSGDIRPFEIAKDDQGYAMAIAVDGWFLIHLDRGTVRNEENTEKLLAILNAAVAMVNNKTLAWVSGEDVPLEKALRAIMPTATGSPSGSVASKEAGR